MTQYKSTIQTRSDDFKANAAAMEDLVADLRARVAEIKQGGGERARERHLKRGKLLPRDRIRQLLDVGSPFLELSQLAAWALEAHRRGASFALDLPGASVPQGEGPRHLEACLRMLALYEPRA